MSEADGSRKPVVAADLGVAVAVAAVFFALYAATLQTRLTGDGSNLTNWIRFEWMGAEYPHLLYLPLVRAFAGWFEGGDPALPGKLFDALCGGIGCGAAFLIARGFAAGRLEAVCAAAAVGLSPAAWFFSTTTEVHALHFAVVGVCACVTLYAPWGRPTLAILLVAATFPLLFLSHQGGAMLGLGWVFLVQVGRSRRHAPFPWAKLLVGHGVLLLAVLAVTVAGWNLARTGELSLDLSTQRDYIGAFFVEGARERAFFEGWFRPLGLVALLGAAGIWAGGRVTGARACVLAMVLPQLGFYVWWGILERGGYYLATAPFLAALGVATAAEFTRQRLAWLLPLFLVAHTVEAVRSIHRFDHGYDPAERARLVEETLGPRAILLSAHPAAPRLELWLPEATEIELGPHIAAAITNDQPPAAFLATALPLLDESLAHRAIALDQSYAGDFERPPDDLRAPFLDALERALAQDYATRLVDDESWPLLVIEGKR